MERFFVVGDIGVIYYIRHYQGKLGKKQVRFAVVRLYSFRFWTSRNFYIVNAPQERIMAIPLEQIPHYMCWQPCPKNLAWPSSNTENSPKF